MQVISCRLFSYLALHCTTLSNKLIFFNWDVVAYNVVLVFLCNERNLLYVYICPAGTPPISRIHVSTEHELNSVLYVPTSRLSHLHRMVFVCQCQPPIHPVPCVHMCVLCVLIPIRVLHIVHLYLFCRFHPCALICNICFSLSDLPHPVFCSE